ncbi:hypothetical protein Tco_1129380, partial [Tanacetum coccineum]
DVDVIVKPTNHAECTLKERNIKMRPHAYMGYCLHALARRLANARQLNSLPYHGQGLEVSRLPDVGLSVSLKIRCIQLNSSSCPEQGWPTSGILATVSKFLSLFVELNNEILGRTIDGDLLLAGIVYVDSHVPRCYYITMTTTNNPYITREDKGKMIITKPEITAISDMRPIHCNKTIEAVVYRKWTSKHIHTRQPMKYCCILMEKQVCTQLPQLLL